MLQKQTVQLTSLLQTEHGVLQAPISGLLLFTMFINDLPANMPGTRTIMFADDTVFLYFATAHAELINRSISKWCFGLVQGKQLSMNIGKTQKIISPVTKIGTHRDKANFMGLILDSTLKWSGHINFLCYT